MATLGQPLLTIWSYDDWKINRVNFGGAPKDPIHYANKVTEMYYEAAEKLGIMSIPQESELLMQLTTRRSKPTTEHGNAGEEQIKLESKEEWAKRQGITNISPDDADAFVLTCLDPELDLEDFVMVL